VDRVGDYLERLHSDVDEAGRLARDLLIGVTGFFREAQAYAVLEQRAIRPLAEHMEQDTPVRVWVPGCSTGEEAYSIAVVLVEVFARHQHPRNVQIFATDIDEEALNVARQGIYPASVAGDISPARLQRFFVKLDDRHYQVNKQLREAVVFAPQDLIRDAPFTKLDLISCRNLLIYLETEVQRKLIASFHFALKEGGHLFLGPAESVGQLTDLFETVSNRWRLFRRISPMRRNTIELPIGSSHDYPGHLGAMRAQRAVPRKNLAELTRRLLLDAYAPAAVLVNRNYQILYFFGPTMDFLEQPTGEPTRDLMAMAREGLRTKLRGACRKALRERIPITVDNAYPTRNGGLVPVEMRVKPLLELGATEPLLLVTFTERQHSTGVDTIGTRPHGPVDGQFLVPQLEQELKATREDLRTNIEKLENANEELKAANDEVMSINEELQSANEELEISKEELQSLNEELSTVNGQLQEKVAELERSNNDITNLLRNTDISTLFLDGSMRIKLFTAPAGRLFNLLTTDIGRPISDLSPNFRDARLLSDAQAVLEKLAPLETEVLTNDGRHLLRRMQPYRTLDNRLDGVVITFVDITRQIKAQQQLREREATLKELNKTLEQRVAERTAELSRREGELRTLAANVPAMFSYVDSDEVYRYVNRLYELHFRCPAEQIVGKSVRELLGAENYAAAKPHMDKVLAGEANRYQYTFEFPDGLHTMDVVYVPDKDTAGQTRGFYVLVHDITEYKTLERKLRDSEQRLRAIVDTAADGIITVDLQGVIRDFNPAAERMFRRTAAQVLNQNVRQLLPSSCRLCAEDAACFRTGHCVYPGERPHELTGCCEDGTEFPMEIAVSEIKDLGLYVALVRDISERKALERRIIEASTLEQERIGRDIHDGIGQQLTAVSMLAASIERRLIAADRVAEAEAVKDLMGHLKDTLTQTRHLARGLSPVDIDPGGLADALSELAEGVLATCGLDCHFWADPSVTVTDEILALHLYRIAQEAVHNALRHAQPDHIRIRLETDGHELVLSVQDDGTGISPLADRQARLGLHIMRYRAGIIGGRLTIEANESGGTWVRCLVPMSS